jgi:hypothetical protein
VKETLKVFTVNHRHVGQGSLVYYGASQSRKPLGSKKLARLRDGMALSVLMRCEVRVKDMEKEL